ncbi:Flp family type IVb pilin [Sphingomonas tabacisoli]
MEYGLIVSLIVIAMLASLSQVANVTIGMWNNIAQNVLAH